MGVLRSDDGGVGMAAGYDIPLREMHWQPLADMQVPAHYCSWLGETGSMTRRLEQCCEQLQVVVLAEGRISAARVGEDVRAQLPLAETFWRRDVILYGDGVAWLFGRTLIPAPVPAGHPLCRMGTTPLGRYLFSGVPLIRESLQVGCRAGLWARCSRLRVEGQLLLLTELFLADAPLYGASCAVWA